MKKNTNQRCFSRKIAILLCISLTVSLFLPMGAFAAGQSQAPAVKDVIITNNAGKSDTVYVGGLAPGETVIIYSEQGKRLSSKKVASKKTDVSFTFSQLGADGGKLYVSVTSPSMTESEKTAVTIPAESGSDQIKSTQVTVTNNSGSYDIIQIKDLNPKDVVKVYNDQTGGRLLKSGTVSSSKQEISLSISQLGTAAGSVYITVTSTGKRESARVEVKYEAEGQTPTLDKEYVEVTNNVTGTKDTIYISGIEKGDTIAVYNAEGKSLSKVTCASSLGELRIQLTQLGKTEGIIYITRKTKGLLESEKLLVNYEAEGESPAIDPLNVKVTNNASGTSDTIFVDNIGEGDTVTVYKEAAKSATWGKAIVSAGKENLTVSVTQLGTGAGSVWISRTKAGMNESPRVEVTYEAEGASQELDSGQVTIVNNANAADVIYVKGLVSKDKVNVYKNNDKQVLLGSATASTYDTSVTITIAQLGSQEGVVYMSLVQDTKRESALTAVSYKAEEESREIDTEKDVTVINNAGIADIVAVSGLSSGDVIKVYRDIKCNELLGKGSEVNDGIQTVSISQLGTDAGTIYLTLTAANKAEGLPATVGYAAEAQSSEFAENNGKVVNKTGASSTLTATGLEGSTTIKVYDKPAGGVLLGSGVTDAYGGTIVVPLSSLPQEEGFVYVTLTTVGKSESKRVEIKHESKKVTAAPDKEDIEVVNNAGIADTITVKNVSAGDMVKVYEENSPISEVLCSTTVSEESMSAVMSISQLGKGGGVIYVGVTAVGKLESSLTEIEFLKETDSKAPNKGNVSILNYSGADDEITVSGLSPGDIVKVYYDEKGGTAIGTSSSDQKGSPATIFVSDLGAIDGVVYVSVKSVGKNESLRTEVSYAGESKAPSINEIIVTNNSSDESDVITVRGLKANDVVKVYSMASGGKLLGFAHVGSQSDTVNISVAQLSEEAGSVYISVTNDGKCESIRVKAEYVGEQ